MFNSFARASRDWRVSHVSGAVALGLSSVLAGCASSPPPGAVPPIANRATVVLTCSDGAFALTGAPPPPPAPPPTPPAPAKPPEPREDRHVYRFDFVLSGAQATNTPDTSFLLTLEEHRVGEALIGHNAPIAAPAPAAAGSAPSIGGARQDVGTKIRAKFESAEKGDDVVLDADAEMSALEAGGSIRKITAHTQLVLAPGKPAVVVGVDEGPRHARLTVTATKLR
jgi:hypothetical protein